MSRKPMPASGRRTTADLEATLAALDQADTKALHAEWRRLHRASPPPNVHRDLLLRGIAYKLQEAALGGLPPAARRKLAAWNDDAAEEKQAATAPAVRVKSGATLLRAWHGQTHSVQVLDDGFEHQGQRYDSLSQIAKAITGAHWSGPRFFGLTRRRAIVAADGGADA